jgi:hypothetical protein
MHIVVDIVLTLYALRLASTMLGHFMLEGSNCCHGKSLALFVGYLEWRQIEV